MKIGLETNVEKGDQPPSPSWLGRKVGVPLIAILAAAVALIILSGAVVMLSSRRAPEPEPGPPASPSATFLTTDTTTQGAWKKVYGSVGYAVAEEKSKFPTFAQIGLPDKSHASHWVDDVEEPRALQKASGVKRIASSWYSWTPFTIDINLTDPKTHRLALYALDWDSVTRVEKLEILDGETQKVLDTREISKFNDGQYFVWKVSGHIVLRVTPVSGANAVLSGLFLD